MYISTWIVYFVGGDQYTEKVLDTDRARQHLGSVLDWNGQKLGKDNGI